MVAGRGRCASEIVARLARAGLRTPRGTVQAVLKVWVLMNLPTTAARLAQVQSHGFMTDADLVNAQIFFVKLALLFSDPFYGCSNNCELLKLFLGLPGLYPLWQMLMGRRYRTVAELVRLKVMYDFQQHPANRTLDIFGISPARVGSLCREPCGMGRRALPTEIIARELIRRNMSLDEHIFHFMLWGHIDHESGHNLAPSEEEIYMEDTEHANRSVDVSYEFHPMHCRKERWEHISEAERSDVRRAETRIEEYITLFDTATLEDYGASPTSEPYEPGEGLYPCADNVDDPGVEDTHFIGRRKFIGHWEASINAQLRRVASRLRSTNSGHGATETDSVTTALSHLVLDRHEQLPEIASPEAQERPGRYRFPTTFDYDGPSRHHRFAGGVPPPIEERSIEIDGWDDYEEHFDVCCGPFAGDSDSDDEDENQGG
ncbi:hypothetical protein F4823DRAFT_323046 [Ustulina deusta]|nr:hypothetical protein F4823DRAFT_323046 [Ustulina deusta]